MSKEYPLLKEFSVLELAALRKEVLPYPEDSDFVQEIDKELQSRYVEYVKDKQ